MSGSGRNAVAEGVKAFAERHGIDRRRAAIAAAMLAAVLIVSFTVMNQRIQQRKAATADGTLAGSSSPAARIDESRDGRAAWADPQEARAALDNVVDSSLVSPGDSAAGRYVPLGHELLPRGDTAAVDAGELDLNGTEPGKVESEPAAELGRERSLTPEEQRRVAFQRAVASRELRANRQDGSRPDAFESTAGTPGRIPESGTREESVVRPYGAAQADSDRQAARRAADSLGRVAPISFVPRPAAAMVTLVAYRARPCVAGERVLAAGYLLTATLQSEINSESPGPVLARVGVDVYDATMRCVIIPAGSLLIGRYPEGLKAGGQRLAIIWEQVRLGNGRSWMIPSLPTADRRGALGVPGEVDRRTGETVRTAALFSLVGAAMEYATPGSGESQSAAPGGYPSTPSPRDRAVGAATQPLRGAAATLLQRSAEMRPVLRLRAGYPITILVPRDVNLDRPLPPPADSAAGRAPAPVGPAES